MQLRFVKQPFCLIAAVLAAILLILVFTNPGEKDFERYAGVVFKLDFAKNNRGYESHYFNMARVGYYGVYSVYLIKFNGRDYYYYGVFNNFIPIR